MRKETQSVVRNRNPIKEGSRHSFLQEQGERSKLSTSRLRLQLSQEEGEHGPGPVLSAPCSSGMTPIQGSQHLEVHMLQLELANEASFKTEFL